MTTQTLRSFLLATLATTLFSACNVGTATISGGSSPNSSTVNDAGTPNSAPTDTGNREVFEAEVEPLLVAECADCHAGSGSYPPKFLQADDVLARVLAHPGLVSPGEPNASSLLTKGEHNGPAFSPEATSTVSAWIESLAP